MPAVAHVLVFEVYPAPGSEFAHTVGRGLADVWLVGHPAQDCEALARAFIMEYGWLVRSLERRVEISEGEIPRYRPDAQASFRQAKAHGISAAFVTSPPVDREDNIVEIRHMEPPHPTGGNIH